MVILFAIKCEESRADSNLAKRAERMTQSSSRFQLLSFSLMSVSLGKCLRLMVAGLTDLRILPITVFIFLLVVSAVPCFTQEGTRGCVCLELVRKGAVALFILRERASKALVPRQAPQPGHGRDFCDSLPDTKGTCLPGRLPGFVSYFKNPMSLSSILFNSFINSFRFRTCSN